MSNSTPTTFTLERQGVDAVETIVTTVPAEAVQLRAAGWKLREETPAPAETPEETPAPAETPEETPAPEESPKADPKPARRTTAKKESAK